MALTGAQRAKVRMLLGWSARFHQTDDRLEQAMSALASQPDDEALVIAEIAKCDLIDTAIDAMSSSTAKAVGVGPLQLRAHYQLGFEMARGAKAIHRISSILGVPIRNGGAFGVGGYDGFAGPFGSEE